MIILKISMPTNISTTIPNRNDIVKIIKRHNKENISKEKTSKIILLTCWVMIIIGIFRLKNDIEKNNKIILLISLKTNISETKR